MSLYSRPRGRGVPARSWESLILVPDGKGRGAAYVSSVDSLMDLGKDVCICDGLCTVREFAKAGVILGNHERVGTPNG